MGDENFVECPYCDRRFVLRGAARIKGHIEFKKGDHLYLVDGSGYLFRAYHALPPLTRKSDGLPTGAVSGYSNMLWKLLEDTKAGDAPSHLAVISMPAKRPSATKSTRNTRPTARRRPKI